MSRPRILVVCLCVVAGVLLVGASIGTYRIAHSADRGAGAVESPEQADARQAKLNETPVVAIYPRRDASLTISVRQLLSVEPYFVADLRAQVAGQVREVTKDIGEPVKKGDLLIDIKVPDLVQELAEMDTTIAEQRQQVEVAKAQADNARSQLEVYREIIEQRRAEYGQALALRDLNEIRAARYKKLGENGNIEKMMIEEVGKDYLASQYAALGGAAAVRKAQADLREKETAVRIAEADIILKERLVEVARKNRDRVRAKLDYTQITAPFDGFVVKRKVDVGTFVQNASTGESEPLMTIARNDIVTIVMKVPDNAAPYVTANTEAIIQIDELEGTLIRGKVTRYTPWIQNKDRTMRVEVDLYNDSPENYERFKANALAARLAGTAADSPLALASLLAGSRAVVAADSKSLQDPLPSLPEVKGKKTNKRLIPGMSGYMRLNLESFHDTYLVPSSAVYTRGGKPYLTEIVDGVAHLRPIHVQVNDGKLAKVSLIVQEESPGQDTPEVLRDLTGNEMILLSRQTEISEGQKVHVSLAKW
jgi:HlyD family secretion protein